MKLLNNKWLGLAAILILLSSGCEGFFGKKTDVDFIQEPQYNDKQVAYVPIQPVLDGFVEPVDVIAGYDELLYVVDKATEEVISLDLAGNELARFRVPGVIAVAQDRSLDLLALGRLDTTIQGTQESLTCIYRIEQKSVLGYGLNFASVENRIIHPFYYKVTFDKGKDPLVNFNGIAVMADNSYLVTRSGPNTSSLFGPDDAVLIFSAEDNFQTTVTVQTSGGFFSDYFQEPIGIAGLAQPPQSPFVNGDKDFIFTSLASNVTLKVQYIDIEDTENGISITVRELSAGDTSKADGFLYEPFRFASPVDVAYSGDGTNYIFVVDAEKDSLYQFTATGLEGVAPPAGSESSKNILVSFGGSGQELTQFNRPSAVAYLNRIVYVADAGNGRVLRYQLTTDFQ